MRRNRTIFSLGTVLSLGMGMLLLGCGDDDSGVNNANLNNNSVSGRCGDGVVDLAAGEECDDGNLVNADACHADCSLPACGDGILDLGEGCDDGNNTDGDGCQADCTLPSCGDGVKDSWEQCDCGTAPANLPAGCTQANSDTAPNACRTSCRLPRCGDGAVDTGEHCDDGNLVNADACHADCSLPACGDGILDLGEGCDDGNNTDGDGCQADCTLPSCGDGVKDLWEQCDCGTAPGDLPAGCTQVNSDTAPNACRTSCRLPRCGDGAVDTGEECDDGNLVNADACHADCSLPACGDGILDLGEGCDDGNNTDGDGCQADCMLPSCGDGVKDSWEQCDCGTAPGDLPAACTQVNSDSAADACRTSCALAGCGDGVVDTGEACDDGSSNSDSVPNACRTSCELPSCGDGVMDDAAPSNESCDGQDFGGVTCLGLVGVDGVLSCSVNCSLDVSGCIGVEWIPLSGGTYDMGSGSWSPTQPVHSVTVPAFSMTETEVTVRQYGHCVTAGACTVPLSGGSCNWGASGYENHPLSCVDWNQAKAFCTWAGGRLPSESEWEYAARSGGQAIDYPWGNATATCTYAVMYEGSSGCGTGRTWAVCGKTAGNTLQGLCDMAGNVWEWVEDDWHSSYTGAPSDGSAWVDFPRGSYRVIRGGSFNDFAETLRAAYRSIGDPSFQVAGVGFRCSR